MRGTKVGGVRDRPEGGQHRKPIHPEHVKRSPSEDMNFQFVKRAMRSAYKTGIKTSVSDNGNHRSSPVHSSTDHQPATRSEDEHAVPFWIDDEAEDASRVEKRTAEPEDDEPDYLYEPEAAGRVSKRPPIIDHRASNVEFEPAHDKSAWKRSSTESEESEDVPSEIIW